MKYRADDLPTNSYYENQRFQGTPVTGLQTQMPQISMQQAPAPAQPIDDATDWSGIASAGVGGAGKAFELIMRALADKQARETQQKIATANNASVEHIGRSRIDTSGRDFDASARVQALKQFLQQAAQSGQLGREGLGNEQAATSGMSSAILNAFKGR